METPNIAGLEELQIYSQSSTTVTWRAYQPILGRHVMVKMLLSEAAADELASARFLSVSRALSRVKSESLCQIFDVSAINNRHYVIMEDVVGQTLAEVVQQNPALPARTVLRYAIGIAEALGKAWTHERFVHRNLKPTTILITADGIAKLTDFGNAFLATPGMDIATQEGAMVVGTPNFIAPEQVNHKYSIDFRSDMYALGALLYFALTAQVPFADQDPDQVMQNQIEGVLPNPRISRPDLPLSVCLLLERLLMKNPGHRYPSWDEAVNDMKRLLEGKPLRRYQFQGTGLSTLAIPAAGPNGAAKLPGANLKLGPGGPGALSRMILWLLLLAWLALLANHRLNDPMALYTRLPQRFPWMAGYLPQPPAAQPVATSQPPLQALPTSTLPPPATPEPISPPPPVSSTAAPPRPAEPAAPAPAMTLPAPVSTVSRPSAATYESLAAAYRQGGLAAMKKRLADHGPDAAVLRSLREALAELEPLDTLAAHTLERATGREIELVYNGVTRKIEPRSVAAGKVTVFFRELNRIIVLDIANFDTTEKIRLLGTSLTPPQAAAVCLQLLRDGEKGKATPYAVASGPLAPVMSLLLNE